MAAAVAVKPVKTGLGQSEACAKQNEHKDTLDTSLLCSKLEEIKREQDAHRLRKEKRNAVRNGHYVPRSAATQFAATATPMESKSAKRRSYGQHLQPIHEPEHTAEPLCRASLATAHHESQKEDASDAQEKRDSMLTAVEKDRPKEDHPVRKSKPIPKAHGPIAVIIPERSSSSSQQESSPDSIVKVIIETDEESEERGRSRSRYTPGDAAKRRQSMLGLFPHRRNHTALLIPDPTLATEPPHRPISFYAIQDLRAARSLLDNELHEPHDEPDTHHSSSRNPSVTHQQQYKPKLAAALDSHHYNRPNWSQKSESGDGLRHLNFFSSSSSSRSQRAKNKSRRDSGVPRGHLVADAVRIIQRQERLRKRQSVMEFFKWL
ncbi:hypothetical protein AC578_9779 [Pseudocercospora eumusae]|uniref:Uncharacterized protein n=1 Tax=Pseudocercospora eumusae TaxID=321146 RepID=A0A139H5B4_9PEZI|nr:hypothetical protein AC578_9779 [Pseudocercospora eumusae]